MHGPYRKCQSDRTYVNDLLVTLILHEFQSSVVEMSEQFII